MKSRFCTGVLVTTVLLACALRVALGQSFELRSKVYGGTFEGFANRLTIAAGDLDGDGDSDLMGGFAEGGLVYLRNPEAKLPIRPPSQTVLAGESVTFEALGTTGTVQWAYVRNASSGTLDIVTGEYTAGTNSSSIDIIEGYDPATELKGRAYVNIISTEDIARAGKAIVLAGRRSASDPLWPTTDYLANRGYNTLLYRGYSKDTVHYLSPVPGRDIDGNAADDDIDAQTTFANTAYAFTNFAAGSDKLFIHMIDHGGDSGGAAYFRLNESETLTAVQLDAWLDALQDAHNTEVTLLIDCCYAGSFLDELTYDGAARRTVIAACGADEPTYFVAGGLVSFSDAFFSGMLLGLNVEESFNLAKDAMSAYQDAAMTGNGDVEIGASFVAGKDLPQIGEICENQTLAGQTDATLWVDRVVAVHPVQRVRALIVPPGHNPDPDDPVANLPELELAYRGGGRYEGSYSGFSRHGTYNVMVYAEDIWGSVSLPRQTYVTQTGFDERVVLLAGGETNDAPWRAIDNMARTAYHTFRSRWLNADQIQYLSPAGTQDLDGDGTNDVDVAPSLAELSEAVTNWAFGANKLTVYLIGDRINNEVRVNGAESLAASALDNMLDTFEQEGGNATLIVESPGAGTFINAMTPLPGRPRIGIAAAEPGKPCCWANDGLVSFSQFFLSYVFRGSSLGSAYSTARNHIYRAAGRRVRQRALLTDPETSAMNRYIGTAFLTGAESPEIAEVIPPTGLTTNDAVLLWASGVTDMDGISNVWCVVTPHDYDGEAELPQTNLTWNASSDRYEALYAGFGPYGTNILTFYAMDTTGEISVPVQSEVFGTGDAYEIDDTVEAASFHSGATQLHSYHVSNDVDWVMFYAGTNISAYEIVSTNLSANLTNELSLYYQEADGSLTWVDTVTNDPITGLAESYVDFRFGDEEGFYFIRMRGVGSGDWLPGRYELSIAPDIGGGGILMVVAVDALNGLQAPSAVINWSGGGATGTVSLTSFSTTLTGLDAGTYTVTVDVAAGYLPVESPVVPGAPGNPDDERYGVPRRMEVINDEWRSTMFRFIPMLQAAGTVQNALTGQRIEGASIEFTARGGPISNDVHNAYPNGATYAVPWQTRADGTFPTNVLLPAVDWDADITAPGYHPWSQSAAITGKSAGDAVDLGIAQLTPVQPPSMVLEIISAHGMPDRNVGTHTNDYGSILTNAVSLLDASGGTQHVCTGWALSGHVDTNGAANGMGTNVVLALTNNASLTWTWGTNYWLDVAVVGSGSVDVASDWLTAGSNVSLTALAAVGYDFTRWDGDVPAGSETNSLLALTMDGARAVTSVFSRIYYTIVATAGPHGSVSPSGSVHVAHGDGTNFEVRADQYYHILDVTLDGATQGPMGATNFTNLVLASIVTNHSVHASFAENLAPSGTPEWWLALYAAVTNGDFSAGELADIDGDGMSARAEWIAGTDPTNALSLLAFTDPPGMSGGMIVLKWHSVSNRYYAVDRSTNFPGTALTPIATNLPATPPLNTYTDDAATAESAVYRVRVEAP